MSYTTAPRPSQTRKRGRGARARGATRGGRGRGVTNQNSVPGRTEDTEQDAEGRMERRDGYTMIAPNEKKREKIAQQAHKEEENYRKYKESRTPKTVSYVGTVGGGEVESPPRVDGARGRGGRSPLTPSRAFGAKSSYKQSMRQREEDEIAKKKADARKKANSQSEQNQSRDAERQRKLDEDRRMKNEAFLARFDKKKPQQPAKREENMSKNEDSACSSTASNLTYNHDDSPGLSQLKQKFPYLDPETLEEMLDSVNGDVDSAIELLSGDD